MTDLPIVMSAAGPIPTPPATIRASIDATVASTNPDYTSNLPGSLVEDVLSTDVYACVESDQFFVDLVNSVTPYGANPFLLSLLGQIYGVQQGQATNTSVYVKFTALDASDNTTPVPGVVIGKGFIVSDGTYQYYCPDGGITGTDGVTAALYAVSTMPGSWGIPIATVTNLISATPSPSINLYVSNPEVGLPAASVESLSNYRSRVLDAGLAASTGMARYLRTLLNNVLGVQPRLVSFRQNQDYTWTIIVGGGDPYQVAYAIWEALFDTASISLNPMVISGMTLANPCVITTEFRHNLSSGMIEEIYGVIGPNNINGTFVVTVIDEYNFSVPVDTRGRDAYVSGGLITPNPISLTETINDYPDKYDITFINPPQELVSVILTWNTNSPNLVSPTTVAQLANPAIVSYINSIYAGSDPINLIKMQTIFTDAIASILPSQYVDTIAIHISVNSVPILPSTGTSVIFGDPFSYFYTDPAHVVINKGY